MASRRRRSRKSEGVVVERRRAFVPKRSCWRSSVATVHVMARHADCSATQLLYPSRVKVLGEACSGDEAPHGGRPGRRRIGTGNCERRSLTDTYRTVEWTILD